LFTYNIIVLIIFVLVLIYFPPIVSNLKSTLKNNLFMKKCKKCGKSFLKKDMNVSGVKGKCKYFARYYCAICSLNPKKSIGYS